MLLRLASRRAAQSEQLGENRPQFPPRTPRATGKPGWILDFKELLCWLSASQAV